MRRTFNFALRFIACRTCVIWSNVETFKRLRRWLFNHVNVDPVRSSAIEFGTKEKRLVASRCR